MNVKSDGSTSQLKGRFNFWYIAGGKFSRELYDGVCQRQANTAPGHGGGPVDNQGPQFTFDPSCVCFPVSSLFCVAGKCAKAFLNARSRFKTQTAYDYATAYELCAQHMQKPSKANATGTWACNGEFIWSCLSNGKDRKQAKYVDMCCSPVLLVFSIRPMT